MSFSSEVKEELAGRTDSARHCQAAVIAALLHFCGPAEEQGAPEGTDAPYMDIRVDNPYLAGAFENSFSRFARPEISYLKIEEDKGSAVTIRLENYPLLFQMLSGSGLFSKEEGDSRQKLPARKCCRKAYLRIAFLRSGSVSDPKKSYHLEIAPKNGEEAGQLKELMNSLGLEAKIISRSRARKEQMIVYLKDGEQISDCLAMMGAYTSVMNLENARILKDIAGTVNRRVNCETANLMKTVDASVRQCEDIRYLIERGALDALPPALKEIAALRLSMPDASLMELSEALGSDLGKSGVNHRLKRLSSLAGRLRGEGGME